MIVLDSNNGGSVIELFQISTHSTFNIDQKSSPGHFGFHNDRVSFFPDVIELYSENFGIIPSFKYPNQKTVSISNTVKAIKVNPKDENNTTLLLIATMYSHFDFLCILLNSLS
jgi:hypothetical protein